MGEYTGGTRPCGSGVHRPGESVYTVPSYMVMATLRWMGVPEAKVRMAEGMYEKTTSMVVVGEGASEEFGVNSGLRRGSVLSPLSTAPHQKEDGGEGCHEETPLCRQPGLGGEWQTGATGYTGGVERAVNQTYLRISCGHLGFLRLYKIAHKLLRLALNGFGFNRLKSCRNHQKNLYM